MAASSFCHTAHARSLSAFSPRKVDGTRAKDPRCAPAGFSQGPAYKSRPGLFTRLGQFWVLASAGGSMRLQDVSITSSLSRSPTHTSRSQTLTAASSFCCLSGWLFHESRSQKLMQFLLPLSRSRSQADTAVSFTKQIATPTSRSFLLFHETDRRLDTRQLLSYCRSPVSRLRPFLLLPIARVEAQADPPLPYRRSLFLNSTDTLRALGGVGLERGREKKKTTSRHTTTV